jgi:hypothetical protein
MRYTATCLSCEPSYTVTGVVYADGRLSLDWAEGEGTGHLEATTTDGVTYVGHYGYPQLDDHRCVRFTLVQSASGELLFLGRWWNMADGGGGDWAFRITPESTNTS